MPVLIWSAWEDRLINEVRTGRQVIISTEEYRAEAEELDRKLDRLLDDALKLVDKYHEYGRPPPLLKAWSLGRSVSRFSVLQSDPMRNEERNLLWEALAHKCWYGARANGVKENKWRNLRGRSERRVNPEMSVTNVHKYEDFQIGYWLSSQDFVDVKRIFGGFIRNALELYRRPALRDPALRCEIHHWFQKQKYSIQIELSKTKDVDNKGGFTVVAKALSKHFTSIGKDTGRLPQFYSPTQLRAVVTTVLDAARDAHFSAKSD